MFALHVIAWALTCATVVAAGGAYVAFDRRHTVLGLLCVLAAALTVVATIVTLAPLLGATAF